LWNGFKAYLVEVKQYSFVEEILIDGSFVTEVSDPNDIDLVVVVSNQQNLATELGIGAYNLIAQNRVRRRFGFDIVVVKNGTESMQQACQFFQQVRQRPGVRKGILRLKL
jgi:hypothetical protein